MRKKLYLAVLLTSAHASGAYKYIRPISIPAANVHSTETDFPITIVGTYPYLATIPNGGTITSSNGYDITFASDSACSTPLNFERAYWNASNGTSEFHVRIPSISNATDNLLFICYGNSSVTTDQQSTAAWEPHYMGVWHFASIISPPLGTTPINLNDSTSNGNNGTASGNPVVGAGQVGGGALFDANSNISMGATSSLQSPSTAVTISAWVDLSTTSGTQIKRIAAQQFANPNASPWWPYYLAANDPSCPNNNFASGWNTGSLSILCSDAANASVFVPGLWYHVVLTYNGTIGRMYINGVQVSSSTFAGTLNYSPSGIFSVGNGFPGVIDEVTVSNTVRSAGYIATTYDNQLKPWEFYTIGPPINNSSQITNVTVQPTTTQAVVSFSAPIGTASSCRINVWEQNGSTASVPDTDPTIFTGANLATRSGNVITGNRVTAVIGRRYKAYYATTGDTSIRWSRALQADDPHAADIICNGEEYQAPFRTATLQLGDTHGDGIPADPSRPGEPLWQTWLGDIRCDVTDTGCNLRGEQQRIFRTTDTQTGVLFEPLVFPGDDDFEANTGSTFWFAHAAAGWTMPNAFSGFFGRLNTSGTNVVWTQGSMFDNSGGWAGLNINIDGTVMTISSCSSRFHCALTAAVPTGIDNGNHGYSVQGTSFQNATITGNTAKLYVSGMNGSGFDSTNVPAYTVTDMIKFSYTASINNAACNGVNTSDDCRIQLCVVLDQVSCAPDAQIYDQVLTNTAASYTIGTGQSHDALQQAGKRIWSVEQIAAKFPPVTCSGTTVTVTWQGIALNPGLSLNPGSIVFINGNQYTVATVVNALQFTTTVAPSPCSSLVYSGFSIAMWKKTSTGDTLTVKGPTITSWSTGDRIPQTFSGYITSGADITMGNGHKAAIIGPSSGQYLIDLNTGDTFPFNSNTGGVVSPTGNVGATSGVMDNNGVFWQVHTDGSIQAITYQGDYQRPFIRTGNGAQLRLPLWEANAGSGAPSCGGAVTSRCNNVTTITQSGVGIKQLLNAFDSRYPSSLSPTLNPFQNMAFDGIEFGGVLSIDLRWNGSQGQTYEGWHVLFDPNATCNANGTIDGSGNCVPGTFGGGCIGDAAHPTLVGCIVAARMTWATPGARWTPDKGSIPVVTQNVTTDQSSPNNPQPQPGSGRALSNIVGTTFTNITCPGGAPLMINSNVAATSCIRLTIDGDPFDEATGSSTGRLLGSWMVGDYAHINGVMPCASWTGGGSCILGTWPALEIQTITAGTGTQKVLVLACINNNHCPTDSPANTLYAVLNYPGSWPPWSTTFSISNAIWWNFKADPHGLAPLTIDYSSRNAHGFALGGLFSQYDNADIIAPLTHYNNRDYRSLTTSQMFTNLSNQSANVVTGVVPMFGNFAGVQGVIWQDFQSHPDYANIGTINSNASPGIDGNAIGGGNDLFDGTGWPDQSIVAKVGTTTYRVAASFSSSLHPKLMDTQATSGPRVLQNVSGPGVMLTDGSGGSFTYCYVYVAGECWTGSVVGQVYFNVPYFVGLMSIPGAESPSTCYDGGFQFANATSDNWEMNDLCLFDAGTFNDHNRYRTDAGVFDYTGWSRQTLGHNMLGGRADIFTAIQGANLINNSPANQWYYTQLQFLDQRFSTVLLKAPTLTSDSQAAARTIFSPVLFPIHVPAGANGAGVEISYDDYGGFCSPNRAETCITTGTVISKTNPFWWENTESGLYSPLSCASTCTVTVPVLYNHVARLTPVYFFGSTIVGRGTTQIIPVQ